MATSATVSAAGYALLLTNFSFLEVPYHDGCPDSHTERTDCPTYITSVRMGAPQSFKVPGTSVTSVTCPFFRCWTDLVYFGTLSHYYNTYNYAIIIWFV